MDTNTKFKILIQRWKDPKYVGDINKINQLADETIKLVNSNPFIKDICEIFMYAISFKAMKDSEAGLFSDSQNLQTEFHKKIAK